MEYRFMGRTGLKVSEICLGCQTFGWSADEPASHDLANRYVEAGGNFSIPPISTTKADRR